MNEFLITIADLHSDLWLRNNPMPRFRMRTQPIALANRIVDLLIEYNTKHFCIAGDLLNKWDSPPEVMDVLWNFYDIIISRIPDVVIYYIIGQHDIKLKDNYDIGNSYVHEAIRMYPNNIVYAHDKLININNTSIYFSGYNYQAPLYPKDKVNVWISHLSFGFIEIDNSKADLIVAGDIHDMWDKGNMHSIGTPYQHQAHEYPIGKVGIIKLDGPNSSFTRVNSDSSKFEFLKLDYAKRKSTTSDQINVILKKSEVEFNPNLINDLILTEVKKNNLLHVHEKIDKSNLPSKVNFDFKITKLVIDNFRSIEHAEFEFDKLGLITYFKGLNGSGKSSIFLAIFTALFGDKSLWNKRTIGSNSVRIQLWLTYENSEYYINRYNDGRLVFSVDGKEIVLGKRTAQTELTSYLPFIPYFNFFYIRPNSHYFASLDKTELFKMIFDLKIFDYLRIKSFGLYQVEEGSIRVLNKECDELIGNIKILKESISDLSIKLSSYKDVISNESEIESTITKLKSDRDLYNRLNNSLCVKEELLKNSMYELSKLKYVSTNFSIELDEVNKSISKYNEDNNNWHKLTSNINNYKSKLSYLESAIVKCSKCGNIIVNHDEEIKILTDEIKSSEEKLEKLSKLTKFDLNDLYSKRTELLNNISTQNKYNEVSKNIESIKSEIESIKLELSKIESDQSTYESRINELTELLSRIKLKSELLTQKSNYEVKLSDCESKLSNNSLEVKSKEKLRDDLLLYSKLFAINIPNSIPYSIMNKLVKYLNTDKVKFESINEQNDSFGLNAYINVNDKWISYNDASDGQKSYLDIFLLIRVSSFMNGFGIILLDEPFINLDANYLELAVNALQDISSNKILITSHTEMFNNYDTILTCQLIDGKTIIN